LTSQVRASGTLLSFVPIILTVVLWFIDPVYIKSFLDDGPLCAGIVVVVVMLLIGLGYFIMMRIADIEV